MLAKFDGHAHNKNMKLNQGMSLRIKILLVLTLIPLGILVLYGALATQIFQNDKIAFVFESSSAVAKTLGLQANTQLSSTLGMIKPALQEYVLDNQFGSVSEGIFRSETSLQWMVAFRTLPGGGLDAKPVSVFERKVGQAQFDLSTIPQLDQALKQVSQDGRSLTFPWKDENFLLLERVESQNQILQGTGSTVFGVLAQIPSLTESFRQPSSSQNFILKSDGSLLLAPGDFVDPSLTSWIGLADLKKILQGKTVEGSMAITSVQGEDLLISYAKIPFGQMFVVSVILKSQALSAVQQLIHRSVIFIFLLLSITLIVGVLASKKLTQSLLGLFRATKKVSEGDFDIQVPIESRDEIGGLAESFNVMAQEVQRLILQTAENARMQSELKTAQTVQETLFPPASAVIGNLRISGFYEPASECGGDWWNYSEVNGKIWLWIGDATGHGAPAALITSATKSAATMIEKMNVEPAQALNLLNQAIYDVSRGKIMMTFFLASFDPKTGEVTYANASHESPYLMRASEKITRKNLVPLNEVNNPRLGHKRTTTYEQVTVKLEKGDRILFFTDGIAEIQDQQKNPWGEREFLKAVIAANKDFPPVQKAVDSLIHSWTLHRQGATLVDDVTLFMAEYTGEGAA